MPSHNDHQYNQNYVTNQVSLGQNHIHGPVSEKFEFLDRH